MNDELNDGIECLVILGVIAVLSFLMLLAVVTS